MATKDNAARDLNHEFSDNDHRKYAYDFDYRMHEFMLRSFTPLMPQGRALELGCFEGMFSQRLIALYDDVTVVEGSSELADITRGRVGHKANVICSRFEAFQPSEKFDVAFLLHTLEHLDDPVGVLARIGTWLKPGGRLFVAVPNAHAASRQIAVGMGLIDYPTAVTQGESLHGHLRTYNLATLKHDIRQAGLTIEESGGVMFKPLANFQFDRCLRDGIVDDKFLEGCYDLGKTYPDLCASVYAVCSAAR